MSRVRGLFSFFLFLLLSITSFSQVIWHEGVRFQFDPQTSIVRVGKGDALFGSDNFRVTLHSYNVAISDYISYQGATYNYTDFNGQLESYFNAIRVSSISATARVRGLDDCSIYSLAVWKEGEGITYFCKPSKGENLYIDGFSISSISASGISALQQKIRELLKEEKEKEEQLEREKQEQLEKEKQEQLEKEKPTEDKTKTDNSTGGGGSGKKEEQKADVKPTTDYSLAIGVAIAYEQEGDRLMQMGNATAALEQYKAAQNAFYSEERAKKIENAALTSGVTQLSQGLNELFEGMERTEKRMDPEGKFDWKFVGLTYESALSGNDLAFKQYALDIQLSFLSFAFGFKFGHATNELQQFDVSMVNWYNQTVQIPEKVTLSSTGLNMEVGVGFNIPVKNFSFRPMYGLSVLSGDVAFKESNLFSLEDELSFSVDNERLNRYALGIYYKSPKTSVVLGVTVSYLTQRVYDIDTNEIELDYHGSNPDYQNANAFYITRPKADEFNVNALTGSFSFIFGISKKR